MTSENVNPRVFFEYLYCVQCVCVLSQQIFWLVITGKGKQVNITLTRALFCIGVSVCQDSEPPYTIPWNLHTPVLFLVWYVKMSAVKRSIGPQLFDMWHSIFSNLKMIIWKCCILNQYGSFWSPYTSSLVSLFLFLIISDRSQYHSWWTPLCFIMQIFTRYKNKTKGHFPTMGT